MGTRVAVKRGLLRFARQERGSQLVELCITLPILLVLMGGAAEFARFYYTYATLSSALRAGARHASKWQKNASWNIPETRRLVVYGDVSETTKAPILPGLLESNVIIQANGLSSNNIESVTVTLTSYRYQPLFDLGKLTKIPGLSLNIIITPSVTMKQIFNGPVNGNIGS